MLGYIKDLAEYTERNVYGFFEDIRYNAARHAAYFLSKGASEGIAGLLSTSILAVTGGILSGVKASMVTIFSAGTAAAFSAGLVQADYLHRRDIIRSRYLKEVGTKLKQSGINCPEELLNSKALDLVAYGDTEHGIEANPALHQASEFLRKERNIGLGLSVTATLVGFGIITAVKPMLPAALASIGLGAIPVWVAAGGIALATYLAVKTPLHWIADKVAEHKHGQMIDDKIVNILQMQDRGKTISQEKVLQAFLAANPELNQKIIQEYGARFTHLRREERLDVIKQLNDVLPLADITQAINEKTMRAESLIFVVGAEETIAHTHNLTLTAGNGLKEKTSDISEHTPHSAEEPSTPAPEQDKESTLHTKPKHFSWHGSSKDGNATLDVNAFHHDKNGQKLSHVELLGKRTGKQGDMSYVQYISENNSVSSELQK